MEEVVSFTVSIRKNGFYYLSGIYSYIKVAIYDYAHYTNCEWKNSPLIGRGSSTSYLKAMLLSISSQCRPKYIGPGPVWAGSCVLWLFLITLTGSRTSYLIKKDCFAS